MALCSAVSPVVLVVAGGWRLLRGSRGELSLTRHHIQRRFYLFACICREMSLGSCPAGRCCAPALGLWRPAR